MGSGASTHQAEGQEGGTESQPRPPSRLAKQDVVPLESDYDHLDRKRIVSAPPTEDRKRWSFRNTGDEKVYIPEPIVLKKENQNVAIPNKQDQQAQTDVPTQNGAKQAAYSSSYSSDSSSSSSDSGSDSSDSFTSDSSEEHTYDNIPADKQGQKQVTPQLKREPDRVPGKGTESQMEQGNGEGELQKTQADSRSRSAEETRGGQAHSKTNGESIEQILKDYDNPMLTAVGDPTLTSSGTTKVNGNEAGYAEIPLLTDTGSVPATNAASAVTSRSCDPPPPPPPRRGGGEEVTPAGNTPSPGYTPDADLYDLHPELEDTLTAFATVVNKLKTQKEQAYFEDIFDLLDRQVLAPFREYPLKTQRRLMAYHMAKLGLHRALVPYYQGVLKQEGLPAYNGDTGKEGAAGVRVLCILRDIVCQYSSANKKLAYKIGQAGYLHLMVTDLAQLTPYVDTQVHGGVKFSMQTALSTLHNCAKSDSNKPFYKELGVANAVLPFVRSSDPEIETAAIMVLALIVGEDQDVLAMADEEVFSYLIQVLRRAVSAEDNQADGYSAAELTEAVIGLAGSDKNKTIIVEKGALGPLMQLLSSQDQKESELAAKAMWMLSFIPENKKKLLEQPGLLEVLQQQKQRDGLNPEHRMMIDGALWTLQEQDKHKEAATRPKLRRKRSSFTKKRKLGRPNSRPRLSRRESQDDTTSSEYEEEEVGEQEADDQPDDDGDGEHIMISYNWAGQKTMLKVRDRLRQAGYRVWMDVDYMQGSTLQTMAEAVEQAAVVLVCMSDKYKTSPNCRTEAEYAFQQRKDIVPLLLQANYQPDGWLGMILGTKLYYDLTITSNFEAKMQELIKNLGNRGKIVKPRTLKATAQVMSALPMIPEPTTKVSPGLWGKEEVSHWLAENKLDQCGKMQDMTGKQLVFLQRLSSKAPEFFYNYLQENLGMSDLNTMMTFTDAVDQLPH